jgi:hypothetical protein
MTTGDPDRQYPNAPFTEPSPYGYIYLGVRIDPPTRGPFVGKSTKRSDALQRCKNLARQLDALAEVVAVTVYEAVLIPPAKSSPRFDVMVLIQTTSPKTITTVESAEAYQHLEADFVMPARNIRRFGDTDPPRSGTFLFNHFTAVDPELALRKWEHPIAAWFAYKAGITDTTLLQPTRAARYVFVNHVRLSCSPIQFFLHLAKPSFRKSVSKTLAANQIGFAAIVCKSV